MRGVATCVALAFGLAGAGALAQDTVDATEKLRACSLLARAERLECLEKVSRDIEPSPAAQPTASGVAPAADNWLVSETTSPLDYSPVAVAIVSSSAGPDGDTLQLSIQCRGGRTDLAISGPTLRLRAADYVVFYAANDGPPVPVAAGPLASGSGLAIKGDVVSLLASLPDGGDLAFRVANRQGAMLEGRYALAGLKAVLARLAVPCKWPAAAGARRN